MTQKINVLVWYEFDRDASCNQAFELGHDAQLDAYFSRTVRLPERKVLFIRQVPATVLGVYLKARRAAEFKAKRSA